MGRPRKIKAIKVTRTRKVKTKRLKNSFLELNKLYEFSLKTPYENDMILGKLKNSNKDEFLIETLSSGIFVILKRENVFMIQEYNEKSILKDQDY